MRCNDCGFNNAKSATVCTDCGAPLNRKITPRFDTTEENLKARALMTAKHEAQKYGLPPRDTTETEEHFIKRVNRDKTEAILNEHESIRRNLAMRIKT